MSVNALIAQGIRPIGADVPQVGNMLQNKWQADRRNALAERQVSISENELTQEREKFTAGQQQDAEKQEIMRSLAIARWAKSAPKAQISQIPEAVELFEKMNGPGSWQAADDAAVQQFAGIAEMRLASALGEGPPQLKDEGPYTLGPGSARYDAQGRVIAQQPFAPANQTVIQLPQGQAAFNPRTGQLAPLSAREEQRQAEAQDAAAVTTATQGATAEAEARKAEIVGKKTFAAFDSAMAAHESALAGTETGPVAGRIPAITTSQQKAVASKAALAPILKQIFRSAGEGIFTDKDQQLLLEMMPDRTLTPEAREFAAQNVRNIVKAKLGIPTEGAIAIESDEQYEMLPSGSMFKGPDGVERRKP